MVLEYLHFQMVVGMKVIGKKENIMEKVSMKLQMGPSMMESGNLGNIMGLEHFNGLMEVYIRENGKTVEKMGKGSLQE
jgi:hypothetical protein